MSDKTLCEFCGNEFINVTGYNKEMINDLGLEDDVEIYICSNLECSGGDDD